MAALVASIRRPSGGSTERTALKTSERPSDFAFSGFCYIEIPRKEDCEGRMAIRYSCFTVFSLTNTEESVLSEKRCRFHRGEMVEVEV